MGVKVGIIGCGRWGSIHLKTLAQLKENGLVSEIHACDLIPSKELEFKDIIDSFTTDYVQLLKTSGVDILSIVTPAETHTEIALFAFDYVKTVFVEKPLSLSEKGALQILSKTQKEGGNLLVGHILRFHQSLNKAMELISEGLIGELQRIDFKRITTRTPPENPDVFDSLAIHGLDTACFCFGETEPQRMSIDRVRFNGQERAINARISLEFPGMKEASIEVGWSGEKEERVIVFVGTKGQIDVNTKDSSNISISVDQSHYYVEEDEFTLPLTLEMKYLIDMHNRLVKTKIYPNQGAILRCMKWIDKVKTQISSRQRRETSHKSN